MVAVTAAHEVIVRCGRPDAITKQVTAVQQYPCEAGCGVHAAKSPCDIRFASREKAIFGQPEVGFGLIPGGDALERLPLLAGRSRAIEIVLRADDFDARWAERYAWINRAVPDDFVAGFVSRIRSFDGEALATAKRP